MSAELTTYDGGIIQKIGFLKKKGRSRTLFSLATWHTRRVIITNKQMLYYFHDEVLKGDFCLAGARMGRVDAAEFEGYPFAFEILLLNGESIVFASTISQADTDRWIYTIQEVIAGRDVLEEKKEALEKREHIHDERLITEVLQATRTLDAIKKDYLQQAQQKIDQATSNGDSLAVKALRTESFPVTLAYSTKIQTVPEIRFFNRVLLEGEFRADVFALIDHALEVIAVVFERARNIVTKFQKDSVDKIAYVVQHSETSRKSALKAMLSEGDPLFATFKADLLACVSSGYPEIRAQTEIAEAIQTYQSAVNKAFQEILTKVTSILCLYPQNPVLSGLSDFLTMLKLSGNFNWTDRILQGDYLSDLNSFDVVIFDLADGASGLYEMSDSQQDQLIAFLKNGKSALAGHDHFTSSRIMKPEFYEFAGFINPGTYTFELYTSATIQIKDHPLVNCHYNFSHLEGLTFPVLSTHTTQQQNVDAQIVITGSNGKEYLVCRQDNTYGCRVIVFNAGHSSGLTFEEKCLYTNILVWLAKAE